MISRDTTSEARAVQIQAQRSLGGAARIALALQLSEATRAVALAGIRSRNPSLTPREARAVLLRRLLGDELYAAAYPNGPR